MTLRKQTKLVLDNNKFEQQSDNILDLSGRTNVYGELVIPSGASAGKVLISNSEGLAAWGDVDITASGDAIRKTINQSSHGFSVQDVVGFSGGTYNKPIADGLYDGEILGLVNRVIDVDNFEFTLAGYVSGLTGLVQSTTYFLSPDTAGLLTDTEPIIDGHLSKTILLAETTTTGWVLPYVGYIVTTGDTASIVIDPQLDLESGNPVANSAVTTAIYTLVEPPNYVAPTTTLTNFTQTVERGSTLTNFTANISFTQNDAGAANAFELRRNTVPISTTQNNTLTETGITSTLTFQGSVSYNEGATKDNILDVPDPRGKIEAGTINTVNRTITPRLRQWWGGGAYVTNSAEVRALTGGTSPPVYDNTNSFTVFIGNTIFVIAIPATKTLSSAITSNNEQIVGNFTLDTFNVNDAGGNPISYRVYTLETALPLNLNTAIILT